MVAVCHPLAIRPPKGESAAASSSTWNGCGSNSLAKAIISSLLSVRLPRSKTAPGSKSSKNIVAGAREGKSFGSVTDSPLALDIALLDALKVPNGPGALPKDAFPAADEDPFFCLLEDDNLVTGLNIKTNHLLEANIPLSDVLLLIHVRTKPTVGTFENLELI